jgi:predicted esterase
MRTTRGTEIPAAFLLALLASACAIPPVAGGDATATASATDDGTIATVPPSSSAEVAAAPAPSGAGSTPDAPASSDPTPIAPPPTTTTTAPAMPPRPASACPVTKDAAGFFPGSSPLGAYVAYVPPGYDASKPLPVLVGMHGCGDDAHNYATWAVAPFATRATQGYIGISLGSETGANHCWSMGADDAKVLAAVDDVARCFWVDPAKVTVSGFSSGGQLAYRVGLSHADRFAGIAIECSSLYAAGDGDALLAGATRKLPIAHRAHAGDGVFPLAKVRADWQKLAAAGFPLATSEVFGAHDGTSADWTDFLLPKVAGWSRP